MSGVVERAAKVIDACHLAPGNWREFCAKTAQTLADAGLLVDDNERRCTIEERELLDRIADNPRPDVDVDAIVDAINRERAVVEAARVWLAAMEGDDDTEFAAAQVALVAAVDRLGGTGDGGTGCRWCGMTQGHTETCHGFVVNDPAYRGGTGDRGTV